MLQKDAIDQLYKTTSELREHAREADERLRKQGEILDRRVDKLVSTIGELINRSPSR